MCKSTASSQGTTPLRRLLCLADSNMEVEHLALIKQVTAALVCSAALLHTPETQDRKIPEDSAERFRETKSFHFIGIKDALAPWIQLWFAELMELCTNCSLLRDKWMQN